MDIFSWAFVLQFSKDTATFNNLFGMLLYWLPVLICSFWYILKTAKEYHSDIVDREKYENDPDRYYYTPTLTLGTIVGRIIVCFIPIANLSIACFQAIPKMTRTFFDYLETVLDFPLVPKHEVPRVKKVEDNTEKRNVV